MGIGSNSCEFRIPDAQIPQFGSVCNTIQSQTSIVCFSSSRQPCVSSRCLFHELEPISCIYFSSYNSDTFCSRQDSPISAQNSSNCSVLASMAVVLRTSTASSVSPNLSATISKTSDTVRWKISSPKSPSTRSSHLGVIKQSISDRKFLQKVADFVSKSRRTYSQKVYDEKWVIFSNWCCGKKVNPVSAPLTAIADFLIFLFSEKKYQLSTIKGYRAMISNTHKFKTGNGSNSVLSELIRSFELQRPEQRSKWDLSLVLICLQKAPFEPLDKASKLHVMDQFH